MAKADCPVCNETVSVVWRSVSDADATRQDRAPYCFECWRALAIHMIHDETLHGVERDTMVEAPHPPGELPPDR